MKYIILALCLISLLVGPHLLSGQSTAPLAPDTEEAIIIHGGMEDGNPFRRIAATTFAALHSIYQPLPGDLTTKGTKWERLRKLYLQDLKACDSKDADWSCNRKWKRLSCLHLDEINAQAA